MNKVLITGANGFLGQKVVDLLSQDSRYELYAISKGENINPNQENYHFQQLDLLDQQAVMNYLSEIEPNYIIHTAAMTSVESCEADADLCQKLNVDVVSQLAHYCLQTNAYLVQISTDFVFDGVQGLYQEDDLPQPLSAYGLSKMRSEQVLQRSGCDYAVLRTILVYGINANTERSNLVLWVKENLSKNKSIRVVNDQWRMPTFVDDLAKACILALEKRALGVFHISGAKMLTIAEVAYQVADFWHLDRSLITELTASDINQADNRPRKTGFILTKAKSILGYQPTSFQDSLIEIDKQYGTFR